MVSLMFYGEMIKKFQLPFNTLLYHTWKAAIKNSDELLITDHKSLETAFSIPINRATNRNQELFLMF